MVSEAIQSVHYLGGSDQEAAASQPERRPGRAAERPQDQTTALQFNCGLRERGTQAKDGNSERYRSMRRHLQPRFCGATAEPPLSLTSHLEPENAARAAKLSWQGTVRKFF
ncbi:MAG: hypothetical protein AB7F32_06970 [Victivallaceae bacterium]